MKPIIIFSNDFSINKEMTGMGYRYWELARALVSSNDYRVTIVGPNTSDMEFEHVEVKNLDNISINELEKDIMSAHSVVLTLGVDMRVWKVIIEKDIKYIYDAVLTPIESLDFQIAQNDVEKENVFKSRLDQHNQLLRNADFFLVGSVEEKQLLIGELLSLGYINSNNYKDMPHRIDVLPVGAYTSFSLDEMVDIYSENTVERIFWWNGGLWNHYSVDNLVNAFEKLNAENIKLGFMYRNNTQMYKNLYQRVTHDKLQDKVLVPEPESKKPGYYDKIRILKSAWGFVLMNNNTLLSELVLPLRIREAFVFLKPVLVSNYGLLGRFVKQYGIGVAVDNSVGSIINGIKQLSSEEDYMLCVDNLKKLRINYQIDREGAMIYLYKYLNIKS